MTLSAHTDTVNAVAFGVVEGRAVLASASYDTTVRLWDPATGQPIGEPLTGHTSAVEAVAFAEVEGRPLVGLPGGNALYLVQVFDPAQSGLDALVGD